MAVNGRLIYPQALAPAAAAPVISANELHFAAACNPATTTKPAASAFPLPTYNGLKLKSSSRCQPCGNGMGWPGASKPGLRCVVVRCDSTDQTVETSGNGAGEGGFAQPEVRSRHAVLPVLRQFESGLCTITIEAPTDASAATDALARLQLLQQLGGSESMDEGDEWDPTFTRTIIYNAGSNDVCRVCTTLVAETPQVLSRASELRKLRQEAANEAADASQGGGQEDLTGMSPRANYPFGYDSNTVQDAFRNIKLDLVSRFECVIYPEGKVPHHLGPSGGYAPSEGDETLEVYVAFRCAGRVLPRLLDAINGFTLQLLDDDAGASGERESHPWYPSPSAKVRVRRKPRSAQLPRDPTRVPPWGFVGNGADLGREAAPGVEPFPGVSDRIGERAGEAAAASGRAAHLATRHGWMTPPGKSQGRRGGRELPEQGGLSMRGDDVGTGGSRGEVTGGGPLGGDSEGGGFGRAVAGPADEFKESSINDAGNAGLWAPAIEARFGEEPASEDGAMSLRAEGDAREEGREPGWLKEGRRQPLAEKFEVYVADPSLVMGSMAAKVQMAIAPYCVGDHELSLTLTSAQLGDLAEAVSMVTADPATLPARSFGERELLLPRTQPRQPAWRGQLARALAAATLGGALALLGSRGLPQMLFHRTQIAAQSAAATARGWATDGSSQIGTVGGGGSHAGGNAAGSGSGGSAIVVTTTVSDSETAEPAASPSPNASPSASSVPSPHPSASSGSSTSSAPAPGSELLSTSLLEEASGAGRENAAGALGHGGTAPRVGVLKEGGASSVSSASGGGGEDSWRDAAVSVLVDRLRPPLVALRERCAGGLGRVGDDAGKLRKRSPALLPYNDAVPSATLDRLCAMAVSWAGDTRPVTQGGALLTHTDELQFQVVTDVEGNLLGCRPANAPAVKQWVNLGVTQKLKRDAVLGRLLRSKSTNIGPLMWKGKPAAPIVIRLTVAPDGACTAKPWDVTYPTYTM